MSDLARDGQAVDCGVIVAFLTTVGSVHSMAVSLGIWPVRSIERKGLLIIRIGFVAVATIACHHA